MKRFHVHVSVDNLDRSIQFYSTLFGATPARVEDDYAKWMLEDPRINFAISAHRRPAHSQLEAADAQLVQENEQACCYARGNKYWLTDPTGIAWKTFQILGSSTAYGTDTPVFNHGESVNPDERATETSKCCVPAAKAAAIAAGATCCGP